MDNAQPEPSMDEILESIRKIISEDEQALADAQEETVAQAAPVAAAAGSAPAASAAVVKTPTPLSAQPSAKKAGTSRATPASAVPQAKASSPTVQKTAAAVAKAPAKTGATQKAAAPRKPSAPNKLDKPASAKVHSSSPATNAPEKNDMTALKSSATDQIMDDAASAATASAFQSLSEAVRVSRADNGPTLEDLVVQMLQPMVKDWLDANLPTIVEDKVEQEIQRVARARG